VRSADLEAWGHLLINLVDETGRAVHVQIEWRRAVWFAEERMTYRYSLTEVLVWGSGYAVCDSLHTSLTHI